MAFYVWLLSLRIAFLSYIHIVACVSPFVGGAVYLIWFIRLAAGDHSGCFPPLTAMDCAAVNAHIRLFACVALSCLYSYLKHPLHYHVFPNQKSACLECACVLGKAYQGSSLPHTACASFTSLQTFLIVCHLGLQLIPLGINPLLSSGV